MAATTPDSWWGHLLGDMLQVQYQKATATSLAGSFSTRVPCIVRDPRRESDSGYGKVCRTHLVHFSICACHPCAGAMLIFSIVPSDSAAWQNIGIVDKLVLALSTPRAPRGSHAGPTRVPSGPTQAPLSLDSSAAKREIPRAGTRDPRGSYAGPTRVPRGSHSPSTPYLPSSFSCKTRNSTRGPHTGPILSLIPHRLGFKILLEGGGGGRNSWSVR